jgi:hypothetical protein
MIVYRTNVSSTLILTAQSGIFYIAKDFGSGVYGPNRGIVKVANE